MLLDSNIIIYAAEPDYGNVREFIAQHSPVVSVVSIKDFNWIDNLTLINPLAV